MWSRGLGDFEDGAGGGGGVGGGFVELDIAIFEDLGITTEEGIELSGGMEADRGGLGGLVEIDLRNSAEEARRLAGGTASHARGEDAVVTVVEKDQGEFSAGVGGDEGRAMLGEEPVGGIGGVGYALEGEVALETEMPEDVSRAGAIIVVNFEEPILVADGDDEVAVVWGIEDGVGVGPIGEHEGTAIDIEVIELVPDPDGFVILVEIDDDIAGDRAGNAGDGFF